MEISPTDILLPLNRRVLGKILRICKTYVYDGRLKVTRSMNAWYYNIAADLTIGKASRNYISPKMPRRCTIA
jgi:hypothetical protein